MDDVILITDEIYNIFKSYFEDDDDVNRFYPYLKFSSNVDKLSIWLQILGFNRSFSDNTDSYDPNNYGYLHNFKEIDTDLVVINIIETVVEPVIDNIVEPVIENIIEPVVDNIIEPVVDNIVEPVVDNLSEDDIPDDVKTFNSLYMYTGESDYVEIEHMIYNLKFPENSTKSSIRKWMVIRNIDDDPCIKIKSNNIGEEMLVLMGYSKVNKKLLRRLQKIKN